MVKTAVDSLLATTKNNQRKCVRVCNHAVVHAHTVYLFMQIVFTTQKIAQAGQNTESRNIAALSTSCYAQAAEPLNKHMAAAHDYHSSDIKNGLG